MVASEVVDFEEDVPPDAPPTEAPTTAENEMRFPPLGALTVRLSPRSLSVLSARSAVLSEDSAEVMELWADSIDEL